MKTSLLFRLPILTAALTAAPVIAGGQSSGVPASSANQAVAATPGKTQVKAQPVTPPRPNQIVPLLPGEIVAPLPHEIMPSLRGQIVRSLPGGIIQPLPGQIVRSLPGQMIQPLPGQIVR